LLQSLIHEGCVLHQQTPTPKYLLIDEDSEPANEMKWGWYATRETSSEGRKLKKRSLVVNWRFQTKNLPQSEKKEGESAKAVLFWSSIVESVDSPSDDEELLAQKRKEASKEG